MQSKTIKIGLSACLAGENVRFDGGHRKDAGLMDALGKCFEFTRFCPEMAIGMGAPRQPVRLVRKKDMIRVQGVKDETLDVTQALTQISQQQHHWISQCSGYIVKKGSPSCGMERVKVYGEKRVEPVGRGLFTEQLMKEYPLMPVEEEGRLKNPLLLDSFVQRVFAYRRWREMEQSGITAHALIQFHTQYKMILLSRNQQKYRKLGQLVATVSRNTITDVANTYISLFMDTLKQTPSRGSHVNVLMHLQGFLKHQLHKAEKQNLSYLMDRYAQGELPLIAPQILLNAYFDKYPHEFVNNSLYLKPYPIELGIYNGL